MEAKYLSDAGTLTATSKRLQAIFAPIRQTHWCPNGFEPAVFSAPGPRSGPLRIGWAGNRNDPCKGLQDILKPAAGGDFELLIAGGDLDTEAMARFYRSIDILCVASTAEGEPLTLVEGMAAGVFPVAVDVGIVPELVRNRENGLIVERKPSAFRAAFQWCRLNPERVRSAGASNASAMASIRRWDDVAAHWRGVLRTAWKELATKPPSATPGSAATPSVNKPIASMSNPEGSKSGHASTAAASMKELKSGYFEHLKAMNPAGAADATYQASLFYYRGELAPLLPESRQSSCLDIGCGFGHLPRFLLEQGFRRVGGIEIDARLHAEAKAYVGDRMEFLEFGDAIPFLDRQNDSFDFITLFDVIEHFTLDDGVALSRGILKSLRLGGRVVMRTPNMANIFGSYSRHMDLTHQIGFTEQSLSQMLRLAGFSEVGVHVPQWDPQHPLTRGLTESAEFHRRLFGLQDRSTPRSFEKNIVVWARR
jgi:2-polyprenyl-3-methyl-5-hydroxy-6-metoxy-1,4-benzoquinol methylase